MSRRTSEASKAVRQAWLREQKLVSDGKGTRDWTPEQQEEILTYGKAYYHSDDPNDVNDGKAFEGHHMKSAEAYPEYQGDSGNIQFLSRSEHHEAHNGDYRNPTNGYYDPITKATHDFGDDKYEPCEVMDLSEPIGSKSNTSIEPIENKDSSPKEENVKKVSKEQRENGHSLKPSDTHTSSVIKSSSKASKGFGERIIEDGKGFFETAKDFSERHPAVMGVLKRLGIAAFGIAVEKIVNSSEKISDKSCPPPMEDCFNDSSDDDCSGCSSTDDYDDSPHDRNYPDKRSSPEEHTVPAHGQHYHTKEGVIWKEKEPYKRGGK